MTTLSARRVAGSALLATTAVLAVPSAAGAAPDDVLAVRPVDRATLNQNGVVRVKLDVRCGARYVPVSSSARVVRSRTAAAEGSTPLFSVRCDGRWQRVSYRLADTSGDLTIGPATITVRFDVQDRSTGERASTSATVAGTLEPSSSSPPTRGALALR